MDDAASIDTAAIMAVVDTNVMIDIHSSHDCTGNSGVPARLELVQRRLVDTVSFSVGEPSLPAGSSK